MRNTLLLIFITVLQAYANDTYSQNTKLSLDLNNVTVDNVLKEIENNSEFYFLFNAKLIDVERKVSISVIDTKISDILSSFFSGTGVNYMVYDRQIILTPSDVTALSDAMQQQQKVTGTVTEKDGTPIPGVNVVVTGTTQGVTTDVAGKYSIDIPQGGKSLTFTFIGFETQQVTIGTLTQINVTMAESTTALEEIVVIGYGTMRKNDLTGSLSSISSDDFQNLNISSAEQGLIGKMPGVQVKQVSGEPGVSPQILIRGINSIDKTTEPLFVVDGYPTGDINMINPNDIERIDILKDASATAIYGSRGTNGVVLITTKHGISGKNSIDVNIYAGVQSVAKKVDMMNSIEIAQFQYDGMRNNNLDEGRDISGDPTTWRYAVPQIIMDVLNGTNTTDTDWQDEVFKSSALVQNYHIGSTGGNENLSFYISGDYYSQEGIIENSGFDRYSVRVTVDSKINNRIKFGGTLNPSYTNRDDITTSGYGANISESILSNALIAQPFSPMYDENGEFYSMFGLPGAVNNTNPVAIAKLITRDKQASKILGNLYTEIGLTQDLNFKVMFGYSITNSRDKYFRPQHKAFTQGVPYAASNTSQTINWLNNYSLNYSKTFKEAHKLNILLGYDIQKDMYENNYLSSDNFPNNLVQTLNAASGIDDGSSLEREWALLSYLGRINYNYRDKYYLTTSLRRDGSSRFGSDKKWGWFPSLAFAWRVSNEDFMKNLSSVSNLKLRLSYGLTGNNNIGDYLYVPTIDYNNYILGNNLAAGYHPNRIANPLLRWEKQKEINLGLDLGLFSSRLNLSADYFIKKNEDLLLNVQIPAITGFSNTTKNIGTIQNKGLEFNINSYNIRGKFNWTTDFNISFYRNKILALGPEGDDILSSAHITKIGEPVGMFFGWITDGVIMSQEELDKAPIFNPGGRAETRVGDFRFKDVSGPDGVPDGIIDTFDRTIMGNPHPDFMFGLSNNLSYKGFELEIALHGVYGNDILYGSRSLITNTRGRRNQMAIMNDYWQSEENPGNGKIPRPNYNPTGNNRGEYISFWLEDGSFLRISNITLGYNLPQNLVNKLYLEKCRLYITAMNLFTFTKYNGYNPDVNDSSSPLTPGEDFNSYPVLRTASFGLNISF